MDEAPIRIVLLCDADEWTGNEALKDARRKITIRELELEYDNWSNVTSCPKSIIAYVDKNRMRFFPCKLVE